MSGAFPIPGEIELDWPASDDACEYRLVLRDLQTGDMQTTTGDSPLFVVPTELVDSSHQYEWKVQHRDAPKARWRNLSPYLLLPSLAGTSEAHTVIEWADQGAPAYRVVIRDMSLGEIAVKAGVRGTEYILDWSALDIRHVYLYRLEAWLGERWTSLTTPTPFPRTVEGHFEHRIVVHYRDPKTFDRRAFASIPAHRMEGVRLEDGWTVTEKLHSVSPSGGLRRTAAYLTDHPDKGDGFLKAFDFSGTRNAGPPTSILQDLTRDYEDECRILERCAEKRLTHVIHLLDRGIHSLPNEAVPVPYIVYERAAEDLLTVLRGAGAENTPWALRVLRQVATGLNQLHREGIAHLDIKASNVLIFDDGSAKIADFESAKIADTEMPSYQGEEPRDLTRTPYPTKPPEWLYRTPARMIKWVASSRVRFPQDWRLCQARDLYHFGSLIRYLLIGTSESVTPAVLGKLDLTFHPHSAGSDYSSALPFIREAFERVVREFENALVEIPTDDLMTGDLVEMFRELCDPDPYIRGDPQGRGDLNRQYSLERYVRRLGLLAGRAESG